MCFFFAKKHFDMCKLWKLWVGSRGNLIPPTREEGRWLAIPRRPWLADCPLNSPPFFCANGEVSLSRHLWKSRCYKSFRYFQWEPQVYTQTIDFERSSRLKFHMTGHCRMERGADLIFQKKNKHQAFLSNHNQYQNKTRPFTTKNHPKNPPGVGPVVFYQTAS